MEKMFIPKKIKIGFQNRDDTFTGKLSYIIYYDEKGKIRKEASWNTWRDKNITELEFDNVPQSGYVFNKGVKRDGYWGSGRSVIRVYDPRDFEFEISVDNLMGILMHSDVSKRDIVEECVFAWSGKELVLLPVNSQEYIESVEYTKKQDQKLTSKDLVQGYVYQAKKLDTPLTYIGAYEWFDWLYGYEQDGKIIRRYVSNAFHVERHESKGKKHVFHDGNQFITKTAADLSAVLVDVVSDNYSNLVQEFFTTIHSQKIVSVVGNKDFVGKNNHYRSHLYFVTNENLVTISVGYEMSYASGKNMLRPKITHSIKKLEYNGSLKMVSYSSNRQSDKDFQVIENAYHKKYNEYTDHETYQKIKDDSIQWLLNSGVFQAYNIVLENGTEIMKPY